jgi:hypothetical protein
VLNIQLSKGTLQACRLVDFTGKVIRTVQPSNGPTSIQLNVVALPSGVYTLLVQTNNGIEAIRWIK